MKKTASGNGWFDLQMSGEERASLLHGLQFALKNYDALDDLEVASPKFLREAVRVLVEKTKPVKDGFVSRFGMHEYMTISMSIWSMLATINAKQIDITKLDPTLDVEKLRTSKQAFNDALPENEITPDLYPESDRPYLPQGIRERKNVKKPD